jgi:large subunit ribosomal protein L29
MSSKELQGLTDQELSEKIREEKGSLNKLELNHKISPVENPAKITASRKNIAKMLTEMNRRKSVSDKK